MCLITIAGGSDCIKMNYINIKLRNIAFFFSHTGDTCCSSLVTVATVAFSALSGLFVIQIIMWFSELCTHFSFDGANLFSLGFIVCVPKVSSHHISWDDTLTHLPIQLPSSSPPYIPQEMHGWASLFSLWGVPHAWLMFRLISLTDSCFAVKRGVGLSEHSRPLRSPLIFAPFWQT